jgi:hypothetical protein
MYRTGLGLFPATLYEDFSHHDFRLATSFSLFICHELLIALKGHSTSSQRQIFSMIVE